MSRLVIICTVCLMFVVYSKGIQLNGFDIKKVLRTMDNNKRYKSTSSEDSSSSDQDYARSLRTMDVLDFIQKNNINEKYKLLQQNERLKKLVPSKKYPLPFIDHRNIVPSNVLEFKKRDDEDTDLNALIKQEVLDQLIKSKKKSKHLESSRLLTPVTFKDDDERVDNVDLNEYSKIFVILDPAALKKSDEESLISKILSLSSAMNKKSRKGKNNLQYYKGFRVKDDFSLRRYRRESKEGGYGGGDDAEPVKKRPSGGGGFGRTGIPFVKNRGDIYEREH